MSISSRSFRTALTHDHGCQMIYVPLLCHTCRVSVMRQRLAGNVTPFLLKAWLLLWWFFFQFPSFGVPIKPNRCWWNLFNLSCQVWFGIIDKIHLMRVKLGFPFIVLKTTTKLALKWLYTMLWKSLEAPFIFYTLVRKGEIGAVIYWNVQTFMEIQYIRHLDAFQIALHDG